ncbi:DUF1453 domain-containing protein [Pseudoxanthomonas sp. LH2527]|uniref:DUF1453 domain-containing protein n=1 Tax=Pseudoxanthomonas sp. LH2527 TaxID=2923249 RepID=UPI001F1354B9|nr:DUF1453 domain-containing protein [Pseudoxanthomonas sp. LH2527]MCH6485152.1 DUF1453 domain-containing protein [Pseudoxanthomonas sp. LH2527]
MPIVLVLVFVFLLLALWVLLLPLSLWQRYRYGRSRRMARGWLLAFNAWSLLVSVAIFVAVSAFGLLWWPDSLLGAGAGLAAGVVLGLIGVWLTRWEVAAQGVFYQPNAWLALLLVTIVAGRIVLGMVQMVQYWRSENEPATHALLSGHGSLLAVAGLLLGYYLVYAWCVKWRVARLERLRGLGAR